MKQVVIKKGKGMALEVPMPSISDYEVLVKTAFSFVSVGTEVSSVNNTGKPLWRRALENPAEVKKVFDTLKNIGLSNTKGIVAGRLGDGNEVGYSSSGTVVKVGSKVKLYKIGDEVACAGAGYAMHAQFVAVPENLVTLKPKKISFEQAATVAVGSIALNSVRRSQPEQGDIFLVIGLGLLGNLACQFLSNNGCRVIGIDPDITKVELAKKIKNTDAFCNIDQVKSTMDFHSKGYGADGVIIAAASKSDDIVSMAFDLCRKKGRVIVMGDVGLALKREDFYKKEIDFLISTSYGPGRYDDDYEVYGEDYPYAFVRWTENRNMLLYLDLIANGSINIDFLTKNIVSIEDSEAAYESLKKPGSAVSLLFDHHQLSESSEIKTKIFHDATDSILAENKAVIGIIGAGSFCRGMHLPNIKKLDNIFQIHAVANRTGNKARSVVEQYKAKYSTTSYRELLDDNQINSVIISTRHDTHASIVCDSLEAGKHVFVEKPLALSSSELSKVIKTYKKHRNQILMVGYNRRFSEAVQYVKNKISDRNSPIVINYNVNAGMLAKDHWLNRLSGGGRNLGEACHMYDLMTFLTESPYRTIKASSIGSTSGMYSWRDNFGVTITFEDGSLCNFIYTSMGGASQAKEEITIFSEGASFFINDYAKVSTYLGKSIKEKKFSGKGHLEELRSFGNCINYGKKLPIPIWQLEQASKISLIVEEKIQGLGDV